MSGLATFVVGANSFSGSTDAQGNSSRAAFGGTTFSHGLQLTSETSSNGKDLLRTNLRGGSFADSSSAGPVPAACWSWRRPSRKSSAKLTAAT